MLGGGCDFLFGHVGIFKISIIRPWIFKQQPFCIDNQRNFIGEWDDITMMYYISNFSCYAACAIMFCKWILCLLIFMESGDEPM